MGPNKDQEQDTKSLETSPNQDLNLENYNTEKSTNFKLIQITNCQQSDMVRHIGDKVKASAFIHVETIPSKDCITVLYCIPLLYKLTECNLYCIQVGLALPTRCIYKVHVGK